MAAHDHALTYGGRAGVANRHLIESALARPFSGYFRQIHLKAAAMLHGVVSNHGFVDGNKRTAWLLTELLIVRSGCVLNIPDDAPVDDLVVAVASGDVGLDELSIWFKDRIIRAE